MTISLVVGNCGHSCNKLFFIGLNNGIVCLFELRARLFSFPFGDSRLCFQYLSSLFSSFLLQFFSFLLRFLFFTFFSWAFLISSFHSLTSMMKIAYWKKNRFSFRLLMIFYRTLNCVKYTKLLARANFEHINIP